MRLAEFYRAMAPFLVGQVSHAEAVRTLYGEPEPQSLDARRLRMYSRAYRLTSVEMLDQSHPLCRWAVLRDADEKRWGELARRFFEAYPQRDFRYLSCVDAFPAFLEQMAGGLNLPAWLPELADFEQRMRRARLALDHSADATPESGPLRLAGTVEQRDYNYDLVGWLEPPESERAPAPVAERTLVLFWRDRDLHVRRETIGQRERVVLERVRDGTPLAAPVPPGLGAVSDQLVQILERLRQVDVVLGER